MTVVELAEPREDSREDERDRYQLGPYAVARRPESMGRAQARRPETVNVLCGLFVWLSPLVVPQLEAEDVESNPRCAPARPNQTLHH